MHCLSSRAKLLCWFALVVPPPGYASAQFTDPRNYQNSPVGVNQIELNYSYTRANASIDPSLIIAGAKLNLNQGTITYTRYFSLLHRMAWVAPTLPLAGLQGSVEGTKVSGSVAGTGDTNYEFAMLLKGGPAMRVAEFENYKPATSLGVSLNMTAPTGLYNGNKVLNLGSDRWSFKPEIGLSHPFGADQQWVIDTYANCYFYTDNMEYRGVEVLKQGPLPGFEAHVSRSFGAKVVGSLDTRFSFRGDTTVNGLGQDDPQQNFILGGEAIVSVNDRNTLTVIFAKALLHNNGPSATGIGVRYDFVWGGGYK